MNRQEFNNKLEKIGLTKKELSDIVGISYTTVNSWGSSYKFPRWLDSWLDMKIELFNCKAELTGVTAAANKYYDDLGKTKSMLDQLKIEIEECRKIKDYKDLKKFAKIKDFIENSGICEDKED